MSQSLSPKPKKSSVRHTRAIQRDQTKRPNAAPPDEQVEALLTEVIQPATFAQVAHFHQLGLRERILTLPVMVAFILSLLWRHIASVREGVRVLNEEGLLWTGPMPVSPQAVLQRLRELPPDLFANILDQVLPLMQERSKSRQRPLPEVLAWATQRFSSVLALDGSTLDALSKKVGLLQERPGNVLAGRMAALLDVASMLPQKVWYEPDSRAHGQTFWEGALSQVAPGMLLLFDLGFVNHALYNRMSQKGIFFVTRAKTNSVLKEIRCLAQGPHLRDSLVTLGTGASQCQETLRLVAILYGGKWYRYVTNVLDPEILPPVYVVALYWQRWRIEEAYLVVKRLLGLAYFACSAENAITTQLWATWILYAVLTDLTDAVAEALKQPFAMISVEMVYRGLYHFSQAYSRGLADDPIEYLARKASALAIIKAKRPKSLDTVRLLTNQIKP
ncbi:MAG: family transposase [Chthonomonadaceae bacterium]|nr:family transposase [Chthonomonadaceae bacterium]